MGAPDGPYRLSANLQLRIPVKLARELSLSPGDEVYWRISDDTPGILQLLPAEVVERRYSAGERLEAASREVGSELEQPNERRHPADG
jgi:antitoxin component of MazEF toxin-antitoxin module